MNDAKDDIRARILQVLGAVAPEARTEDLRQEEPYRNQFTFDSVDFLNFAIKLQREFGLSIPEDDFPLLATLRSCVEYISARDSDDPDR